MRIAPDLNLGTAALRGSAIEEVAPSSGRLGHCRQLLPRDARKEGHSVALVKSASGFDELERQYQEVYAEQLPGVPYYDDCHHLLLTLDGPREVLAGGATVRLLLLTVASRLADERILRIPEELEEKRATKAEDGQTDLKKQLREQKKFNDEMKAMLQQQQEIYQM